MQPPSQRDGPLILNNADSFAQAFDEAWHRHSARNPGHGLTAEEKLPLILAELAEHPFRRNEPALAEQVGRFRLRLLGL
jgi:hypothetical protein